jgi:glycosyltransferase involved in cell wall biosynthesis
MRVCIVTASGYVHGAGGMQNHASDLARGLAGAGHEVEVVTSRHPDGLREAWHDGALWRFVDTTTRHPRLPFRRRAWFEQSAEAFADAHAQRPFDVVHSESTSALGLLRRGVDKRVPTVVKFHGNYLGVAKETVRRALLPPKPRQVVPEAKHFVWITARHFVPPGNVTRFRACEAMVPSRQQLEGTIRSYFLKRSRVHVVPNGVDTEFFRPRPQAEARATLGIAPGPLLLCVGRLNRGKGLHHAVEALSLLRGQAPSAQLVVVGAGEEREALETLAGRLGVAPRVRFVGRQPREAVARYLAAADVFVFPVEQEEAAPLAVLEAMSVGVPVVAARIGGVPEVIDRPGENGVLFPPADAQTLAEAVGRLVSDDELRRRVGAAGRQRVAGA